MSTVAIGTPQYGAKKKNNFRLKDGSNIYRILPPLGTLAADGIWAVYDSIHWGYKGTKGHKPFKCIQKKDFKTKMVKVQCPECDKIAEYKSRLEDETARLKASGKTKEEIDEFLKPLADWLYSHNLDKKWYMNAMDKDGQLGRLAIPHKMYSQLQELITDIVTKKGVDPIAVDGGVWFDFIRSGKGRDTTHRVAIVEQNEVINGRVMSTYKPAPLTQDVLNRLGAEAWDLKNAVRVLNYDEINRIVSSGGDEEVVDGVFGNGEITKADEEEPESDVATTAAPVPSTVKLANGVSVIGAGEPVVAAQWTEANKSVTVSAPAPTPVDPQEAMKKQMEEQMKALQAQLAALQAAQSGATVARPAVTPAPTPVADPTKMTDDDFIKQFGFGK